MFCVAHVAIRNTFEKQFHFNTIACCLTLTLAIIWFAIPITLPVSLSLFSSVFIAFLICFFGYLAQDRVDRIKQNVILDRKLTQLLSRVMCKDIFAMSEEDLYKHCRERGLDDNDCKIAYYIIIERLKGRELYEAIGYSESQSKRKRKKILDKLK